MGESEPAWVKYANAIGILALLTGVIYFNPLGGSPSLPAIPSIPSIPSIFDSFRIQRGQPLDELAATLPNGCPAHKFKSVRHLSRAPDIMIIEGFLTPEEADVLVEVAYLTLSSRANLFSDPLFEESKVVSYVDTGNLDKSYRDSWSAYLPEPENPPQSNQHQVIRCIEDRATRFQGHRPIVNLEALQVVKYHDKQQFREHTDWFDAELDEGVKTYGNRESSFFVYLVTNCTGGTTAFTKVPRPKAPEWCDVLVCHDEAGNETEWVEVRPKVGTAIFWYNLDANGVGDEFTLHAGTPVINGTKIGLNIWTRQKQWRLS